MGPATGPLVLVSGFGPFEVFEVNPSAEIARALAAQPPPGVRVRAAILPVSFARAPEAWDELQAELLQSGDGPALFLGIGVASKRTIFSLERFAGPRLKHVPRPDVDGRLAEEFSAEGPPLESAVDLERLLGALRARGVEDVRISTTAGGYVCERIYHHLLTRAAEHGVPGLFVHVPPVRFAPLERQIQVLGWVLEELVPQLSARPGPSASGRGAPPRAPRGDA